MDNYSGLSEEGVPNFLILQVIASKASSQPLPSISFSEDGGAELVSLATPLSYPRPHHPKTHSLTTTVCLAQALILCARKPQAHLSLSPTQLCPILNLTRLPLPHSLHGTPDEPSADPPSPVCAAVGVGGKGSAGLSTHPSQSLACPLWPLTSSKTFSLSAL